METEKWSRRLRILLENPDDRDLLDRIARDFGHSLPTASLQSLRELRAEIAAVRDEMSEHPGAAFATGLLSCLCEVSAAYDAEVRSIHEKRNLQAFVRQEIHAGLLRALADGVSLPGDLARRLSTSEPQVSRALKELQVAGLVEIVAPGGLHDGRTRPRALTVDGWALVRSLGWQPEVREEPPVQQPQKRATAAEQRLAIFLRETLETERQVLETLERRRNDPDVREFSQAVQLVERIVGILRDHVQTLSARLEGLADPETVTGGVVHSGIPQGIAGFFGKIRRNPASRDLRDDYVGLSLVATSYTTLHAAALGLEVPDLVHTALRHLANLAPLVAELRVLLPRIAVRELTFEGFAVEAGVEQRVVEGTRAAWQEGQELGMTTAAEARPAFSSLYR